MCAEIDHFIVMDTVLSILHRFILFCKTAPIDIIIENEIIVVYVCR